MRILIVGAGALGGYFGARLLDAGRDVTFLLRPRRAAALARNGLIVRSPLGDLQIPNPPHVTAHAVGGPYDLVIVGCKAYDLDDTMHSFAPAVGAQSAILPLLNGMAHIDRLAARFGEDKVLGGWCMISAALDEHGVVQHFNDMHGLSFGERDGSRSSRIEAIEAAFAGVNVAARASTQIMQEMWEKWVFIASAAGLTCLMRGSVGDVVAAGAADIGLALLDEANAIADAEGFPPRADATERNRLILTAAGSPMTASMFKDIERGAPTEGDHLIADLLARGEDTARYPMLRVVDAHLKTYAARRAREAAAV
jgi:2-dehydropantoate 2-reductase